MHIYQFNTLNAQLAVNVHWTLTANGVWNVFCGPFVSTGWFNIHNESSKAQIFGRILPKILAPQKGL